MRKTTQKIMILAAALMMAVNVTGCSKKARMARHQQRADRDFAAGEYAQAEIEYLIALRLDRENVHAIGRLGTIYYEQGRFGRAYSFVQKAAELATNDVDMHVKLGLIYLNLHSPKNAHAQAIYILDRWPTNAEAPDILAESCASREEVVDAQNRLEKISKKIGDTAPLELAFAVLDFASGDIKATDTALKRALTLDPKYGAAYYTLGNFYVSQNKMKEADEAFKKSADLSPVRSPRRLSYANFKIQTGDLAEGKRLLDEITKQAPDYVPAWIRKAEIALNEKRYDDCDGLIGQALARDADNYDALMLRGRMYIAENQADKAVAEFDRITSLYAHSAEAFYYLAVAHLAVKDSNKAVGDLNKALFLRPKFPEATLVLAGLNIDKGDTASAISSLTQMLRDRPNMPEPYLMLANAYVAQKNPDQALATYAKMIEIFPKNPQPHFLSGMILANQKKNGAARKEFETVLELSPHSPMAVEELVNLDIADKQFQTALDRVNKELDSKQEATRQLLMAKVHVARAQMLAGNQMNEDTGEQNLGIPAAKPDVDEAVSELGKAIELDPNQPAAYLYLAKVYVAAGNQQAALDRLNGLVSKTNNAAAYMQIGTIEEMLKNYPSARDAYEKVLAVNPDFGPALNNLAYLYCERLGDMDKASSLAQKAYDNSPGPATADTLGWVLYKKGDYSQALKLLNASASKLGADPEIQLHLGLTHYMLGDESAARQALQVAASSTDKFPHKEDATNCLAMLAVDPKTADAQATALLEKRLQERPDDPVAASRLGAIYERDGATDKAAKIYDATLKRNPQNAQLMAHLARLYISLNNSAQAMDLLKNAHKVAPDDATISCELGRLVFASGDYDWAASLLLDAAPQLPGRPDVQHDLAWAYYSKGRVKEAVSTMKNALPGLKGKDLDDAKQFLAMVAAADGPTAATAAQAGQILSANPNYVPAMMVIAAQEDQQDKKPDAATQYEKVLDHFPSFAPAARNLAILRAQYPGDDQKALDAGVKARSLYPKDAQLARALGVLAYRRGDYFRAVQFLQESSQTLSSDGELLYYLGMSHYQLNQKTQSKAELQRALGLNLESKLADDARKRLAELK